MQQRTRVESVDLLRGVVMAIMALDHVRDFFHADAQIFSPDDIARTNGLLFFTRWITHFCAPVFVFLAGVSVHFFAPRRASHSHVSRFLVTRGIWLIAVEMTLLAWAFSFNLSYRVLLLQVLWAMGWSMIALAGLIWLPRQWILTVALAMILFHNAFDRVKAASFGPLAWFWNLLHIPSFYTLDGHMIGFLYPLVPWIGVMAAGYCFGPVMQMETERRRQTLFRLGGGITAAFLVLRFSNLYGDVRHWSVQSTTTMTIVSFFNVSKYPPSLLYLLMTLGPAILLLGVFDRLRPATQNYFRVLGRVPMFYYLLHFYTVHAVAVALGGIAYGNWTFYFQFPAASLGLPAPGFPERYGYSLGVVYLVWLAIVGGLYFPCRWYMNYKNRNHSVWLSYL